MRARTVTCAATAWVAALVLFFGATAQAAIFTPGTSSLTIHFDPDISVVGGNEVTKQVAGGSVNNVLLDLGLTTRNGSVSPDKAQAAGGGNHSTVGTATSDQANIVYPLGLGALQSNVGNSFFGGAQLKLDFNFNWDVSDGWNGPILAYQSLSLAVSAPLTSSFSILGDFTYTLNVQTPTAGNSPFIALGDIDFARTVTGTTTTQNVFLFDSATLTTASLPVVSSPTATTRNTLNLTGSLTLTAVNDKGPTDTYTLGSTMIGMDIDQEVIDALNVLLGLCDMDMEFEDFSPEAQAKALELQLVLEALQENLVSSNAAILNLGQECLTLDDVYKWVGGGIVGTSDVRLRSVVPLPGAFAMGLAGMAVVAVRRRRKA